MRSIGFPELIVILVVLGVLVVGVTVIVMLLSAVVRSGRRSSGSEAYCTKCGNGLPKGAEFCGKCGTRRV
jgi:hypothetical protein